VPANRPLTVAESDLTLGTTDKGSFQTMLDDGRTTIDDALYWPLKRTRLAVSDRDRPFWSQIDAFRVRT